MSKNDSRLAPCKDDIQKLEKFIQDSAGVQRFANLIGYDQSTVQRWLGGDLPVPRVVLRLIDAERKYYEQFTKREKAERELRKLKRVKK